MYYSTIALAALLAATMVPFPIAATIVLPNLSRKVPAVDEDYDCQVLFNTAKDTNGSPEEIAMFEQALLLSANEVYGQDEMHLDKVAVKTAKHGPKVLVAVEGGGINEDNDIDTLDISKNLLRGGAQVGRYIYSTAYVGSFSANCNLCNDDAFTMDTVLFDLAGTKKKKKRGKKHRGNKHALWEETLCDLLNQTPAFENAEDCEIVVTKNGKLEPVLGDGAMEVITTEFIDMEEGRN
jgi:hypothetical protein